jgi:hypothetical protein
MITVSQALSNDDLSHRLADGLRSWEYSRTAPVFFSMKALYDNELSLAPGITPETRAQRATLLGRCEL